MNLALFDFDGTISTRDSFLLFLKYSGGLRFYSSCVFLSPCIVLFLMNKYPNQKLKEGFIRSLFKGQQLSDLEKLASSYCQTEIPRIIRPAALKRIEWHKQQGDTIAVVTATPRIILEPWCRNQGLAIIGSELEIDPGGRITGRLNGQNCRGQEKVRRISADYQLTEYREIYAYGDTSGDTQMLELAPAGNRYFKPFREEDD